MVSICQRPTTDNFPLAPSYFRPANFEIRSLLLRQRGILWQGATINIGHVADDIAAQTESEVVVPVARVVAVAAGGNSGGVGAGDPATATHAAGGGIRIVNILAPLPNIPAHVINS